MYQITNFKHEILIKKSKKAILFFVWLKIQSFSIKFEANFFNKNYVRFSFLLFLNYYKQILIFLKLDKLNFEIY